MNIFKKYKSLPIFLVLLLIVSTIAGAICLATKHVYRQSANDPQIEIAQAVAEALEQGAPAEAIIEQSGSIDLTKSTSMFITIFDKDGKLIASSAKIGEETPTPPTADIDVAKNQGENRFTWKPQKDITVAAVVKKAKDDKGIALVGKNIKETESRIQDLSKIIAISWGILVLLSAVLAWLLSKLAPNNLTVVEENIVVETKPE